MKRKIISVFALLLVLTLTSAAVAQTNQVILVSDNAADSGVAEILAEKTGAEVVYTNWGNFSQQALDEVKEIAPEKAVIVGGKAAVPPEAEDELAQLEVETERLAGRNRYETAARVAEHGWGANGSKVAMVAQGYDGSGIELAKQKAKKKGIPMLYGTVDEVPEEAKESMKNMNVSGATVVPSPEMDRERIRERLREQNVTEVNETERNMTEAAEEAVEKAREAVQKANGSLPEMESGRAIASHRLYSRAADHLSNAEDALSEGNYGKAFGQATSAMHLAENSGRVGKGITAGKELGKEVNKSKKDVEEKGLEKARERVEEVKEQTEQKRKQATERREEEEKESEEVEEESQMKEEKTAEEESEESESEEAEADSEEKGEKGEEESSAAASASENGGSEGSSDQGASGNAGNSGNSGKGKSPVGFIELFRSAFK